jgi:hypothetical protein
MDVGSLSQNGSACVALGRERPGGALAIALDHSARSGRRRS